MKKNQNIAPLETNLVEVRYLEENRALENYNLPQEIAIPENFELNWVSKDTCFTLSPTQLEKVKKVAEKVFKLTNETWLEMVKQKKTLNREWIRVMVPLNRFE